MLSSFLSGLFFFFSKLRSLFSFIKFSNLPSFMVSEELFVCLLPGKPGWTCSLCIVPILCLKGLYCIVALCPKLKRPRNHFCFILKLGQVESELFNELKIISNCVFLDVT